MIARKIERLDQYVGSSTHDREDLASANPDLNLVVKVNSSDLTGLPIILIALIV